MSSGCSLRAIVEQLAEQNRLTEHKKQTTKAYGTKINFPCLNKFLQCLRMSNLPLYFDKQRALLYQDLLHLVGAMLAGKLQGNRHGRMVLGPKGCGKTTFLMAMACALHRATPANVAVFYVDLATLNLEQHTPLSLIIKAVKDTTGIELNVTTILGLLGALDRNNIFVICFMDEYHTMYARPSKVGEVWREQMFNLGNHASDTRRHLCVLLGSAPYMRALCFGKYPQDSARYPSYMGVAGNLNSARFPVQMLGPFSNSKDLTSFCSLLQAYGWSLPDVNTIMAMTGGNLVDVLQTIQVEQSVMEVGLEEMEEEEKEGEEEETQSDAEISELMGFNQLSVSHATLHGPEMHLRLFKFKHLMEGKYGLLWGEMLAKLEKLAEERNKSEPLFSDPWGLVAEIPVDELSEQFQDCRLLYDATDAGALVYNQNFDCDTVRFLYPLQALYCRERLRQHEVAEWLTPHLRLCLRYPYSIKRIHGSRVTCAFQPEDLASA
ncbi:hypothetical protein QOT17_010126 [Balamuthia mandrillaris]